MAYMPAISILDPGWHAPGYGWPGGTIGSAVWPTANMIYYAPFVVADTYTATAGWIMQQTAGAATTGRVGVYSSAAGEPITLLGQTNGTIDLTTAGTVIRRTAFVGDAAISPGNLYFAAITVNTGAAWTGVRYSAGSGPVDTGDMRGWRQEAGSGTLPSTATPADYAPATEAFWIFGLTSSTTVPL